MALLDMALRPAAGLVALGRDATRTASRVATDASLATLDAVLGSRLANDAVDRVLGSDLARTAVTRTIESELARTTVTQALDSELARTAVSQVLDSDLARTAVTEAVRSDLAAAAVAEVLASDVARNAVSEALEGPLVETIAEEAVRLGVVERLTDRVLTEQLVAGLLDRSAAIDLPERVAAMIFTDERLLDQAVERLLASPALWQLVDEIAQSPAVMAAITAQSAGFADEVAGGLRARSRRADMWLEGAARKALRRPHTETP